MGCISAFVRHLVCLLAFFTWLLGSLIVAWTLWVLSTSQNLNKIFTGNLPVTYVTLGLGSLLFLNGFLGWIGSYKRGPTLKIFLFLSVLTIAAEIGGIIALSILRTRVSDIITQGWNESNDRSRNIIQGQLECCGLYGPSDFAHKAQPIDETCYHTERIRENTIALNSTNIPHEIPQVLNRTGCKEKLEDWIEQYRITWLSIVGGFLLFQVITVLLSVSAVNHMKSRTSSLASLDDPHALTYM